MVSASADIESFAACLKSSDRILALLGAGLSAASGLPTFRGAGGIWRNHDATLLATPGAFNEDPALVWRFYSYRKHMALEAQPNRAHRALAELAKRNKNFLTLSQNIDGLSQRAGHPPESLHLLHGSLFDLKCTSFYCDYFERDNFQDPIVPALALPSPEQPGPSPTTSSTTNGASSTSVPPATHSTLDISNPTTPLPPIPRDSLPHCPACKTGLLRPAVVWFGEMLPQTTIRAVHDWIDVVPAAPIDLMLVIGTSGKVHPAAGYIDVARAKGARVAVVNVDPMDGVVGQGQGAGAGDGGGTEGGSAEGDWFFEGDAGVIVPEILKGVVGEV